MTEQPPATGRDVRGGGRLHRRRRQGRRADEGVGRQGPPPRDARRHRRLRRALRRQRAEGLRPAAARHAPPTASAPRWRSRRRMDVHHTIGFDLVGMLVDDLVVCGAEPLFLTDYIATGRVVPERIAAIVQGIAEACVQAGCALVGGETAEHPGLLGPDEYDVAGLDHRRRGGRRPARPGPGPGRRRRRRDGARAGCTPTATRWCGTCCSAPRAGPAGRWTGTSTSSAAPSARSCSSRPGSTPRPASTWPAAPRPTRCPTSPAAGWPPTSSGCCPTPWWPRSTAAPGPRSRSSTWSAGSASVAPADLERTLNCGVGHGRASPPPTDADRAVALLAGPRRRGVGVRRGQGRRPATAPPGGSVTLTGSHPGWS